MIKNNRLELFDGRGIIIDMDLPKYKVKETNAYVGLTNTLSAGGLSSTPMFMSSDSFNSGNIGNSGSITKEKFNLRKYLIKLLTKNNKKKDIKVQELIKFFDNLKSSVNSIDSDTINNVLENYEAVLSTTESTGQIALVQKLKEYSHILKYELILSQSQFTKYLNENDIVNFYNIASKHDKFETKLKISYVKNFVKVIPLDVIAKKIEADNLLVFDNYVILHYDYKDDSVAETKEEEQRRKDPILFGIIQGSTKLYYIGDWVSDYCDLTLDQLIVKLGQDAKNLNSDSINKSIENI